MPSRKAASVGAAAGAGADAAAGAGAAIGPPIGIAIGMVEAGIIGVAAGIWNPPKASMAGAGGCAAG